MQLGGIIRNIYILTLLLSTAYSECIITGCSGQICAEEPMTSDCEWLDYYTCFQFSDCGNNGIEENCSWLLTEAFLDCLDSFGVTTMGCINLEACNYNPDAIIDDGSCIYAEGNYDCDGDCLVELDCAGNCCVMGEEGCYWQEMGPCGESGPSNGMDSCGVCGGNNSSCADCAGVPCSNAYEDNCGVCDDDPSNDCVQGCDGGWGSGTELDECGVCGGNNSCLCDEPFNDINGHCLHQDDIAVLQAFIDNSLESGFSIEGCDPNDPWCSSPNLYMDQSDNWHEVLIDGEYYQFSNDNGLIEPLELGLQQWTSGRLKSLMCGAYIYCQLSGEIPGNISDLTEINILRLEVNYFTGLVPENICGIENLNYNDYLSFDLSYNMLCPPYPECVPEGAVNYMDISGCGSGDVNGDGVINVIDIVIVVDLILSNNYDAIGDVNADGELNILDVVVLIDLVLNGDPNESGCTDGSSWDYDTDGICDADDVDDDNDGALDPDDSDDNNEYVCSDIDGDNCDDCSSGTFDLINDGPDMNGNGICDEGDMENDFDGDGVIDDQDSDPFDPYQCSDNDGDTCDDCSSGTYNTTDDGYDYDADGQCDAGDCDDDNDGCPECSQDCP